MTFEFTHQPEDLSIDSTEYRVEAVYTFVTDGAYGTDADGNRGRSVTFLDDYEFSVYLKDKDVTQQLREAAPSLYAEIEKAVEDESEAYYEHINDPYNYL